MTYTRQGESSKKSQGDSSRSSRRLAQGSTLAPQHASRLLQQTLGNQSVLRRMEAGLRINDVNDPAEREADRVAAAVMAAPGGDAHPTAVAASPAPAVQRKCAACEEEEALQVQRKESSPVQPASAPPIVGQVLSTPGQPLDGSTRSFMESRFGHDFGGVRVHTDGQAAQSAHAVGASAYTVGSDIVFDHGEYNTEVISGNRLLAHELAHVIQQGNSANVLHRTPKDKAESEKWEVHFRSVEDLNMAILVNRANALFRPDYAPAKSDPTAAKAIGQARQKLAVEGITLDSSSPQVLTAAAARETSVLPAGTIDWSAGLQLRGLGAERPVGRIYYPDANELPKGAEGFDSWEGGVRTVLFQQARDRKYGYVASAGWEIKGGTAISVKTIDNLSSKTYQSRSGLYGLLAGYITKSVEAGEAGILKQEWEGDHFYIVKARNPDEIIMHFEFKGPLSPEQEAAVADAQWATTQFPGQKISLAVRTGPPATAPIQGARVRIEYPVDPQAYKGIDLAYTAEGDYPTVGVESPPRGVYRSEVYWLVPYLRAGTGQVVYYKAYNPEAKRDEYVVGPNDLKHFLETEIPYANAAWIGYPAVGDLPLYQKLEARSFYKVLTGHPWEGLKAMGGSWPAAVLDPNYYAQITVVAAPEVAGIGSPRLRVASGIELENNPVQVRVGTGSRIAPGLENNPVHVRVGAGARIAPDIEEGAGSSINDELLPPLDDPPLRKRFIIPR